MRQASLCLSICIKAAQKKTFTNIANNDWACLISWFLIPKAFAQRFGFAKAVCLSTPQPTSHHDGGFAWCCVWLLCMRNQAYGTSSIDYLWRVMEHETMFASFSSNDITCLSFSAVLACCWLVTPFYRCVGDDRNLQTLWITSKFQILQTYIWTFSCAS